jgi:hypothetical protein
MNHNLETVPRLYRQARPGADYAHSLRLLQSFKQRRPAVHTKSGLMLGLGEAAGEVLDVMRDLRAHCVDVLTLGQYLRPSPKHLPIVRYVAPEAFAALAQEASNMGFTHAACGRWCAQLPRTSGPGGPLEKPISNRRRQPWTRTRPQRRSTSRSTFRSSRRSCWAARNLPRDRCRDEAARRRLHQADQDDHRAIIFCTVVVGIAGMEDMKKVGKTGQLCPAVLRDRQHIALIVGLGIVNPRPGAGMDIDAKSLDSKSIAVYTGRARYGRPPNSARGDPEHGGGFAKSEMLQVRCSP